jgi:uncharacterized membrane-anchored protein
MKVGRVSISAASVLLLVIQMAIISTIAGKYLYQRWRCPRVWVRSMAYDPDLLLRGRYLSVQVTVDGCQSTLLSAEQAAMPHDKDGLPSGKMYIVRAPQQVQFEARLRVQGNTLEAIRIPEAQNQTEGQMVMANPGSKCNEMQLETPVDFYIPEHAADPTPSKRGQELWVEVTVPPNGPPRPVQLALKDNGAWTPLSLQ